ncbi:MAG: hypothetical protein AAF517_18915 [Planctomycetota bacterium]
MLRFVCVVSILFCGSLLQAQSFSRGDVDRDGRRTVFDAFVVLEHLFSVRSDRVTVCEDAADTNDDGCIDVADPIYSHRSLFANGPSPAAPFPGCGEDPTEDALGCEFPSRCVPRFRVLGHEFRTAEIVFLVERSGAMVDSGEFARAKQELVAFLRSPPAGIDVGLVVYSNADDVLPYPTLVSTDDRRETSRLVQWIFGLPGSSGHCVKPGLHAAFDLLEDSSGACPVIGLYGQRLISGDRSNDQQYILDTLSEVAARNQRGVGIVAMIVSNERGIPGFGERIEAANPMNCSVDQTR